MVDWTRLTSTIGFTPGGDALLTSSRFLFKTVTSGRGGIVLVLLVVLILVRLAVVLGPGPAVLGPLWSSELLPETTTGLPIAFRIRMGCS